MNDSKEPDSSSEKDKAPGHEGDVESSHDLIKEIAGGFEFTPPTKITEKAPAKTAIATNGAAKPISQAELKRSLWMTKPDPVSTGSDYIKAAAEDLRLTGGKGVDSAVVRNAAAQVLPAERNDGSKKKNRKKKAAVSQSAPTVTPVIEQPSREEPVVIIEKKQDLPIPPASLQPAAAPAPEAKPAPLLLPEPGVEAVATKLPVVVDLPPQQLPVAVEKRLSAGSDVDELAPEKTAVPAAPEKKEPEPARANAVQGDADFMVLKTEDRPVVFLEDHVASLSKSDKVNDVPGSDVEDDDDEEEEDPQPHFYTLGGAVVLFLMFLLGDFLLKPDNNQWGLLVIKLAPFFIGMTLAAVAVIKSKHIYIKVLSGLLIAMFIMHLLYRKPMHFILHGFGAW